MKKFMVLLVAVVLIIAVSGLSFAAAMTGTITKIDDGKITVRGADGSQTTVAGDVKGLKVGDSVTIVNGKVIKKRPLL